MNLYNVYSLFDITPVRGKGSFVYDASGKEYLDFYGGHAVISIGHSHPHYVHKISNQLNSIGFYSNSVQNPLQQQLADTLEALSGIEGFDLFFINSGAEANENALKLASFYNQRSKVLALENSFHGRTSAAINITQTGQKHQAAINKGIDVNYHNFQEIDAINEALETKDYSAIIIEGIQGVGGLDAISNEALTAIRQKCNDTDTILIMDEVQCGYGRSGHFFSFQKSGIKPDIITVAKGMGNGFPIGGVLIDAEKMPAVKSRLGTTYGGNHLACAAGIAVLEVIRDESLIDNAKNKGAYLKKELLTLPGVKQIKGRGLMLGLEFDFPVASLRKSLVFEEQLFTGSSSNPNLLRLLPPLNITHKETDTFLEKVATGISKI